ncbi:MAG: aromatic amino acid ammonia-lyase [Cyclobacteriaceae bacterium]
MVTIGGKRLDVEHFENVIFSGSTIQLNAEALDKVKAQFDFLLTYSKDKVIYGINTGLGPMAQVKVEYQDQIQLQLNLIRSHASGSGQPLAPLLSRATMLARLNSLMIGASGVHPDTVELVKELLNRNISSLIFERGGVGASGDLVQLAHLALNLLGEGEVLVKGDCVAASEVFAEEKITPMSIHIREGLALMNGTSAMTGIGMVNLIYAKKIFYLSLILSSITNEIMKSFDDHFSKELNDVKRHKGQTRVAALMREYLQGSKLIRKRADHLYNTKAEGMVFTDKVQEYYSLRCVPQVLGPVMDTLEQTEKILVDELNSVSDNPIIDEEGLQVHHGGNFHGDYVSLEMDKLKIVVTRVAMLAERQLNYLVNDKLNQKLPPFINLGKLGLNFGMQGLQFTATSTTAENQTLAYPMYLHSIPNNNDNQDIVSMGCNAALIAHRVVDNTFVVLAIQAIGLAQAIEHLDCKDSLSPVSKAFIDRIRRMVPKFIDDTPKYKDIEKIKGNFMLMKTPKIF